jgi:hypothetical protein
MVTLLREAPALLIKPTFFSRAWLQASIFLLVALALMVTTFGDTNRHVDETFYFLVGQRMHEGLLPYVDVWDRKPLGLFLIYYLIAGISTSVLAYQIAACLFAAATAFVVAQIVQHLSGGRCGVLAGLCYLVAVVPFEGITGQTPDFYNLFIALAALLVVRQLDGLRQNTLGWRGWAAMALCGMAITIKQTALFESLFLGLYLIAALMRAGAARPRVVATAMACAAIGALPMALIAGFYWQAGHWPEFWQAMVTSNFTKALLNDVMEWLPGTVLPALPLLVLAVWGIRSKASDAKARKFVAMWAAAAVIGFLSVPNFYPHYMLPLMVPLSVAAGLLLAWHGSRITLFAALLVYALLWFSPFRTAATRESNQSMAAMVNLIRQHDGGGGLLVFDAPPYLYALSGKRFLSPLVFPHHLNHAIENNVSHLTTNAEIDRIIAARPGVIVMSDFPRNSPVNAHSRSRVLTYARAHCVKSGVVELREGAGRIPTVIFGDCR